MIDNHSIAFFDRQFRTQPKKAALLLNPFEQMALPFLHGEVLDFGCGMGNLAFEAARRGCKVLALDGSPAAIEHIQARARDESLPVSAAIADLRHYAINGSYDCIVSIGLLMFFNCAAAARVLQELQSHVRPGGVAVINVLIEGTTYFGMFDPTGYCLFDVESLQQRFIGWEIQRVDVNEFDAPNGTIKRFCTLIARRPQANKRP
jgi:tellurite methyltransferase